MNYTTSIYLNTKHVMLNRANLIAYYMVLKIGIHIFLHCPAISPCACNLCHPMPPPSNRTRKRLAQAALLVSLVRAQATEDFITKSTKFREAREYAAIKDCFDETVDTVHWLSKSVSKIRQWGNPSRGRIISSGLDLLYAGNVSA